MKVFKNGIGANKNVPEKQARAEELVVTAIKRLGGEIQMRVMEFRRHLDEPLRETHIKEALKRLCDKGVLTMTAGRTDPKGQAYKLLIQ